jgi:uncharacterized protein
MQISLDSNRGAYYVRSYQTGEFKINDQIYNSSLILTSDQLIQWAPQNLAELTTEYLMMLIELKPEVAILGTGEKLIFPDRELLKIFYQHKIGIEVMDTNAACRTYNVLTSEGRNVVAGLLVR